MKDLNGLEFIAGFLLTFMLGMVMYYALTGGV